ncbi:MAG TPA: hypothetical protein VE978_05105 [Chitinophagales bacterium]|nr:hypothetical protein [Chitinophagales bacterium]
MKILIVEDDYSQADWLVLQITDRFKDYSIDLIETELEFRTKIKTIEDNPPELILMDIMLRWTNPSPEMVKPPIDIAKSGIFDAGFRCQNLLKQSEKTRNIQIIFYSVLDKDDLESKLKNMPSNVVHLKKEANMAPLFNQMRKALKIRRVK